MFSFLESSMMLIVVGQHLTSDTSSSPGGWKTVGGVHSPSCPPSSWPLHSGTKIFSKLLSGKAITLEDLVLILCLCGGECFVSYFLFFDIGRAVLEVPILKYYFDNPPSHAMRILTFFMLQLVVSVKCHTIESIHNDWPILLYIGNTCR